MTWLGKILTFVVMLAAIIWMYFSVQAYATRTNWKTEYENAKANEKAATAAHAAELNRSRANEDALKRLLVNEQVRTEDLQKRIDTLAEANTKNVKEAKTQQDTLKANEVELTKNRANLATTNNQMDTIRARNTFLEDQTTRLVLDTEKAKQEMVRAQNQAKLNSAIAEDYAKKIDELQAKLSEMRLGPNLRAQLEKPPPPLLSNLRGEVERVEGLLVVLSIGADAGLSKGSVLDLSRLDGGGRYLGTVKVMDLYSKQAVAQFTPARANVATELLRPEELPKKGDQVRPQESSIVGR
jgi:hypothetical protein